VAGKDVLLYSNCDSPSGRRRGTVWASFDGGQTWPVQRLVFEGAFAYSSMTAGRPGTPSEGLVFLHFEGGPQGASTMARFNLSWVLGDGGISDWVK
jgi:sialidase-1